LEFEVLQVTQANAVGNGAEPGAELVGLAPGTDRDRE